MRDFEQYKLGIKTVDSQHQTWFDIYYELVTLVYSEKENPELLSEIIEKLHDYTHYHFQYEEKLLREISYPDLKQHKSNHKNLYASISWYKRQMEEGKIVCSERILHTMEQWILTHILVDDRKYVEYIDVKKRRELLV